MLHGEHYRREDILSAVEFARGADTAVRREKPPDETLSAKRERERERKCERELLHCMMSRRRD